MENNFAKMVRKTLEMLAIMAIHFDFPFPD